ncbi:MAG: hypothetical protein ACU0GG_02635 [Paracoccaceae bacterium]
MSHTLRWCLCTLALVMGLGGCARDTSAQLWAQLDRWFELEQALYFKSKFRCTVAIYRVASDAPRNSFPVQADPQTAKQQFRMGRGAAVRMAGYSPHDIADALLLSGDGVFGREVLAAAAQAGPCFRDTAAEGALRRAMTRPGATLAYDRESEGMMILDPDAMAVFYVAGDVF